MGHDGPIGFFELIIFSIDDFNEDVASFNKFIIGSSIRYGVHDEKIIKFIKANKSKLDVIKTADHIIDMGPEGGVNGGEIIAEGTPEKVSLVAKSYTGNFIKELLGPTSMKKTA